MLQSYQAKSIQPHCKYEWSNWLFSHSDYFVWTMCLINPFRQQTVSTDCWHRGKKYQEENWNRLQLYERLFGAWEIRGLELNTNLWLAYTKALDRIHGLISELMCSRLAYMLTFSSSTICQIRTLDFIEKGLKKGRWITWKIEPIAEETCVALLCGTYQMINCWPGGCS